jgi:type I restriction-modification system DNA methylase subunit
VPQQLVLGGAVLEDGYRAVYGALTELRETFHRSGRLDDSNAKLDEVAKLFATYLAYKRHKIRGFPAPDSKDIVAELQVAFEQASQLPEYLLQDRTSIFGTAPRLSLRAGDEGLAAQLAAVTRRTIDLAFEARSVGSPFDALNEAFGHFVRDNFRGNIEDAQYMTPPEVVDFMTDMAIADLRKSGRLGSSDPLVVLDPTCGVGSFLGAVYNRARRHRQFDPSRLRLFGQDKIDRMVRLATLNLELFEIAEHRITAGNSLALGSPIDTLEGEVDLILTNPPFGARFSRTQINSAFGLNTPFFASLNPNGSPVDSELLFLDRDLQLLKHGGLLIIVLPDGVVSAKGMAAMLRHYVRSVAELRAIVALPSVTFGQAGTRTRTVVLYLRKARTPRKGRRSAFIGTAEAVGFQVSSRKGVQVKVASKQNDLPSLLEAYKSAPLDHASTEPVVIRESPSAVLVPSELITNDSWTPAHYSATRFRSLSTLRGADDFDTVPLGELVEFCTETRPRQPYKPGVCFISVLHVLGEGLLDMSALRKYAPKTPGIPANPGEILLSKINPRIPRVCVVPELGRDILCSTEFEILRPTGSLSAYALAYLLQTRAVQEQIASLTSGTSASHNRIRTTSLARVSIPIPHTGSGPAVLLKQLEEQYGQAIRDIASTSITLSVLRGREIELL